MSDRATPNDGGIADAFADAWRRGELAPELTSEQRAIFYYRMMAGPYPAPNRSAIAAILAHRIVEAEDAELDDLANP